MIARVCYHLSYEMAMNVLPLGLDGGCSVTRGCSAVEDALHEPLQGNNMLDSASSAQCIARFWVVCCGF